MVFVSDLRSLDSGLQVAMGLQIATGLQQMLLPRKRGTIRTYQRSPGPPGTMIEIDTGLALQINVHGMSRMAFTDSWGNQQDNASAIPVSDACTATRSVVLRYCAAAALLL